MNKYGTVKTDYKRLADCLNELESAGKKIWKVLPNNEEGGTFVIIYKEY